MPAINIPIGSKVEQSNSQTIEIKVPGTKFWIEGIQQENKTWNTYLKDPQTGYKEEMARNKTTNSFRAFSNIILKTPFPYQGKRAENSVAIKKFLKQITKCKIKTQ